MRFFFCEVCGVRLTDNDLAKGAGKDKKLAGVYCSGCAEGVLTMESLPITEERARSLLAAEKKQPARPIVHKHVPASTPTPAKRGEGPVRPRARHEDLKPPQGETRRVAGIVAGTVIVLLLGSLFWLASRRKPAAGTSNTDSSISEGATQAKQSTGKPDPAGAHDPSSGSRPPIAALGPEPALEAGLVWHRRFEPDEDWGKIKPRLEAGVFGQAFRFDGKAPKDGGVILTGPGIRNSAQVTVAVWLKSAAPQGIMYFLENRHRYRLHVDGQKVVANWTQIKNRYNLDAKVNDAGEWFHFALTCDGVRGSLFVDGKLAASCDTAGGPIGSEGDGGYTLRIGGRFLTSGMGDTPTFNGWMDDLRVYSRALSAEEIAELAGHKRRK